MANGRRGPRKRVPELAPVRRVSVVDSLVEQMTRKILGGDWPPGTVLPSLRDFAASTGVSMLTVREAVRALQARGWVEPRQGVGTFVLEAPGGQFVPWHLGASDVAEYRELVEARESIEAAIIGLAARRRTDAQLVSLDSMVSRMAAALGDRDRFLEADAEFHVALAEAAHNRILLRSMLAIRVPLRRLMADRLLQELTAHGDLSRSWEDHRAIAEGVRSGVAEVGCAALLRITERGRSYVDDLGTGVG
ncbi:FadR/GntR family transcriptional regulator [Amycolatopsis jejuensis]|uniref:FadR/GntR family transcriptional regulator n=1 Tax=Amycolatopsis jejuensis TaxID=330084 RepID=UPI00068F7648|nr:FadR/GntR family transcriptional regulator [Amycolatopsis jejuensis]